MVLCSDVSWWLVMVLCSDMSWWLVVVLCSDMSWWLVMVLCSDMSWWLVMVLCSDVSWWLVMVLCSDVSWWFVMVLCSDMSWGLVMVLVVTWVDGWWWYLVATHQACLSWRRWSGCWSCLQAQVACTSRSASDWCNAGSRAECFSSTSAQLSDWRWHTVVPDLYWHCCCCCQKESRYKGNKGC